MLGVLSAVMVSLVLWRVLRTDPADDAKPDPVPPAADAAFPAPPPFTSSPFANADDPARFIGTAGCAECHRREHLSFLHSAHAEALGDIRASEEPPDGEFIHEASGRRYRVYRDGKTLRHQETLRTGDGREIGRVDFPIRYRIGSGNFTRTYIVEVDGFLHESPITWYSQKKRWDLSPGYDAPSHSSFERGITMECLACHAGRVEPVGDSISRLNIVEQSIGCESCHGPGSLHRDRHRSKQSSQDDDRTIVHPGKLSRELLESICGNCHQSEATSSLIRGRGHGDFRPGRPLSDYRLDYRFDTDDEKMTVVGHMEQLRRSKCYQATPTMTCLTCHHPHPLGKQPRDATEARRGQCMSCHDSEACREAPPRRQAKSDDCVSCHMPRGDTDIPHVAFTHHRIGKHPIASPKRSPRTPELLPINDFARVPEPDRRRGLGLAYAFASQHPPYAEHTVGFRNRAIGLLEPLHREGLRDDEISAALASLLRTSDPERALEFAREAARSTGVPPVPRAPARAQVGIHELKLGNLTEAEAVFRELAKSRRNSNDCILLAQIHLARDEPEKAIHELKRALDVRPFRAPIHSGLADAYQRLGDLERAREHRDKAEWLSAHNQN
ncbi:MAG: tetratricopeptide repeat protein [Gemmataceae bacterium]